MAMTEHVSSTIFLCLFLLIRSTCRIYSDFGQFCIQQANSIDSESKDTTSPTFSSKKLLPSPELGPLKMLSPFASIKNMTPLLKTRGEAHFKLIAFAAKKQDQPSDVMEQELLKQTPYTTKTEDHKAQLIYFSRPKHIFPDRKNKKPVASPLTDTQEIRSNDSSSVVMCACGSKCEDEVCKSCAKKFKFIEYKGYLYEKSDETTLNRCWFTLVGDRLYKYMKKKDTEYAGMYLLVRSFLKEEPVQPINKKICLYPLRIYFPSSQLVLYSIKSEEAKVWANALKNAMGYSDLTEFYELGEPLGRGKYGVVCAATNKQTGAKVAIKILKKAKLTLEDLSLAKREIEVLKVCQHPNVIQMLDTFENHDYIYIVLELLEGGDLCSYLEKWGFKLSESHVRNLIHSLATGLYYLHSYGIVHRDIKLENIMMTNTTESAEPKITDFGLSKMIGPNEHCDEPFGTIGYAAPEIINDMPYNKQVDIWSLGVVLYIIMTGMSPFAEHCEQKIAIETVTKELDYKNFDELGISAEAKDCVQRMLTKDPEARISLKELLMHPWLTMNCRNLREMRESATSETSFRINALSKSVIDELAGEDVN